MSEFMEKLRTQLGYITDDMMEDAVKELGKDFIVIVKSYEGARYGVRLEDMENAENELKIQCSGIKQIFINSDDYDKLFQKLDQKEKLRKQLFNVQAN